ncbi:hypothetical protein [Buttiauxella sp. S19-1]|uniref:hypothetical protein n=1 Tax=Buttiauxella sp. S19-1 TaxID=941430 RepID=UPI001EDA4618|nr:hypothetical protein [Buttiauxella sp. S19-1]
MKRFILILLTGLMVSASVFAAVTEQEWGNWYGNTGGMEFALSSQNAAGQELTLSCSDKKMTVRLSSRQESWSASSDEGLEKLYLMINQQAYQLENTTLFPNDPVPASIAFEALAHTGARDSIVFTSQQTGDSKPFSARGLSEALRGKTWQDCLNQP